MKPEDVKVGMYVKNGRKDIHGRYYGIIDNVYLKDGIQWDIMWLNPKNLIQGYAREDLEWLIFLSDSEIEQFKIETL